jgi:HPt (histidine-containing phosphotransfer) domain-containing protein
MSSEPFRVEVHPALRAIAPDFLERARRQAVELREALDTGDLDCVSRVAHQLAGAGTSFGMPTVTELGREIERAVNAADPDLARARLFVLTDYLSRVELA